MEMLVTSRRCRGNSGFHIMLPCGCAFLGGWVMALSSPMTHFFQASYLLLICDLHSAHQDDHDKVHWAQLVPWSLESDAICFLILLLCCPSLPATTAMPSADLCLDSQFLFSQEAFLTGSRFFLLTPWGINAGNNYQHSSFIVVKFMQYKLTALILLLRCEDQTQDLIHARQIHYPWTISPLLHFNHVTSCSGLLVSPLRKLCNHHWYLAPEHFYHSTRKPVFTKQSLPVFCPSSPWWPLIVLLDCSEHSLHARHCANLAGHTPWGLGEWLYA